MKKYLFAVSLLVLLGVPATSSAFAPTAKSMTRLSDTSVLFTLQFDLGYDKYGLTVPRQVKHSNTNERSQSYATYSLRDEDGEVVTDGALAGALFSNAPLRDGAYTTEPESAATFTFMAIYTNAAGLLANDYTLQLDSFPFQIIDGDEVIPNGLSIGEIKSFQVSN